jgi:hypothetical protein
MSISKRAPLDNLPPMIPKRLFKLWQPIVGLLLLSSVGYGVFDSTHSLWGVAFVLGVILVAVLLVRSCLNPSHASHHFCEDDFTCWPHNGEATPGGSVSPLLKDESGIQLIYDYHLTRILLLKTHTRFVGGVIKYQHCLDPDAMYNNQHSPDSPCKPSNIRHQGANTE